MATNKILPPYLRNVLNLPSKVDDFVSGTSRPVFRHDHSNDSYTVLGTTSRFALLFQLVYDKNIRPAVIPTALYELLS